MEIRNWTEAYCKGRTKGLTYEQNDNTVIFNKAENPIDGREWVQMAVKYHRTSAAWWV